MADSAIHTYTTENGGKMGLLSWHSGSETITFLEKNCKGTHWRKWQVSMGKIMGETFKLAHWMQEKEGTHILIHFLRRPKTLHFCNFSTYKKVLDRVRLCATLVSLTANKQNWMTIKPNGTAFYTPFSPSSLYFRFISFNRNKVAFQESWCSQPCKQWLSLLKINKPIQWFSELLEGAVLETSTPPDIIRKKCKIPAEHIWQPFSNAAIFINKASIRSQASVQWRWIMIECNDF